jgi:hypothetical protein
MKNQHTSYFKTCILAKDLTHDPLKRIMKPINDFKTAIMKNTMMCDVITEIFYVHTEGHIHDRRTCSDIKLSHVLDYIRGK